jgi:hypothetical protein
MRRPAFVVFRSGWNLKGRVANAVGELVADVLWAPMEDDWPPPDASGVETAYGPNPRKPGFAAIIYFENGRITKVITS